MKHLSFPSIEQFRHVQKNIQIKSQFVGLNDNLEAIYDSSKPLPIVDFVATVKTHGTNHGIQIFGDKIVTQSRSRIITPEDDNNAASKWSFSIDLPIWQAIKSTILVSNRIDDSLDLVIYGEWCGKGINAGCAIHNVDRFFVIFAAKVISDEDSGWLDLSNVDLVRFNQYRIFNVFQFGSWKFSINFNNPIDVAEKVNKISELTLEIEKECPVGRFFGVSGVGEGVVLAAQGSEWNSSKYWMKSKGNLHSKSKIKKLATINIDKIKSIQDFLDKYVDEERLQQGLDTLKDIHKDVDQKQTGDFLKWVVNDIRKEELDTITENQFIDREINSAISRRAREWFQIRAK